jgi:hypothetical protein
MPDYGATFDELRALMLRAAPDMQVCKDTPSHLELHAPWPNPLKPRLPMWFGAVKSGRAYVSFHLMPLYVASDLSASIPAGLRKRMHGKTCFNFKTLDAEMSSELEALTRRCAAAFAKPLNGRMLGSKGVT